MANVNDLVAKIAVVTSTVTALSVAQTSAFARKNQRLASLNVDSGSVVSTAIVSGRPGTQIDMPVRFIPGNTVSAMQFDLLLPSGFTFVSATAGPAAVAAQKSVSANPATGRVLVFGINTTVIGEGVLLTIRLSTASSTAPRSYSLGITNVIASDPSGIDVPISGLVGQVKIQ